MGVVFTVKGGVGARHMKEDGGEELKRRVGA
jgi:hypothetical protein